MKLWVVTNNFGTIVVCMFPEVCTILRSTWIVVLLGCKQARTIDNKRFWACLVVVCLLSVLLISTSSQNCYTGCAINLLPMFNKNTVNFTREPVGVFPVYTAKFPRVSGQPLTRHLFQASFAATAVMLGLDSLCPAFLLFLLHRCPGSVQSQLLRHLDKPMYSPCCKPIYLIFFLVLFWFFPIIHWFSDLHNYVASAVIRWILFKLWQCRIHSISMPCPVEMRRLQSCFNSAGNRNSS